MPVSCFPKGKIEPPATLQRELTLPEEKSASWLAAIIPQKNQVGYCLLMIFHSQTHSSTYFAVTLYAEPQEFVAQTPRLYMIHDSTSVTQTRNRYFFILDRIGSNNSFLAAKMSNVTIRMKHFESRLWI